MPTTIQAFSGQTYPSQLTTYYLTIHLLVQTSGNVNLFIHPLSHLPYPSPIHPPMTQISTPTDLNCLYTYLPLPSSASQTHALPELSWDLGTLEDAVIWGLRVGGGEIWDSLRSRCWS